MPFKSKRQQRFMFAAEERGEVPKGTAKRWAHETKNIKGLPEKKKKKPLQKKSEMTKWTAFVDELSNIAEGGPGDTDSSSRTKFPYGPEANKASQ